MSGTRPPDAFAKLLAFVAVAAALMPGLKTPGGAILPVDGLRSSPAPIGATRAAESTCC